MPLAVAALAALIGTAVIAAPTGVARSSSGASLDAAMASKVQQLTALKGNITESECDYAVDAAIIEGCDQLIAQAQSLAAEIEALKAETGKAAPNPAAHPSSRSPI